jgi:hypothetical protein
MMDNNAKVPKCADIVMLITQMPSCFVATGKHCPQEFDLVKRMAKTSCNVKERS